MTAGFVLALIASDAHAQAVSPATLQSTQRARLTSAQLQQILATAIPMETVLADNPLDDSRGSDIGGSGFSQLAEPQLTPDRGEGFQAAELRATTAYRGRVERVGRRFMNMYPDAERSGGSVSSASQAEDAVGVLNFGTGNRNTIYHYSDSLVVPFPIFYAPYRSAGRYLFQAADGFWYTCSAALIDQAILVTAGHCVHDGAGTDAGWNLDGYFFPGYTNRFDDASQRYGYCQTTDYVTTDNWYANGQFTTTLAQGVDVAMALCGRLTDPGWVYVSNRLPGEALGYFGFCYENCILGYTFLTQLGYPSNYYGGLQMTVSQHLSETALTGGPDYVYGTGMQGGSSGGPHIQNIGNLWDQASNLGRLSQRNIIVAVTSWGYNDESVKIQGASPISGLYNSNNAIGMFNEMCAASRTAFGTTSCTLIAQ